MGYHGEGNASRLMMTDVILVCEARMCYIAEVLMVCENCVVICMHLWCVDPMAYVFYGCLMCT